MNKPKRKSRSTKKESATPLFAAGKIRALRLILDALVEVNLGFLKCYRKLEGKSYPSLYDVVPKYVRRAGDGVWQDIPFTAKVGSGDVCDLVCWRVAELRYRGFLAHPVIKMAQTKNGGAFIATVQVHIGGLVEDPTAILGGSA